MTSETPFEGATPVATANPSASDWVRVLAHYRQPDTGRSIFEIAVTLLPFFAIWGLCFALLSVSPLLSAVLAGANGLFLVRLFCIQHDCGHG
ncbi:MAG: fatty acid desaturase, partial [Roseobacter sp.]